MIRLLASAVLSLLANAVALVATSLLLPDFSLDAAGFLTALVLFTVIAVVIEPLIRQTALKNTPALLGSSALVATFVSLVLTAIIGDGLRITGVVTWVLATVGVWGIGLVARLLLPLVLFKKVLSERS